MGTAPTKKKDPAAGMDDQSAKLRELIESFDTVMLVAGLAARPMAVAKLTDDGAMWFITSKSASQTQDLKTHPEVMVVMQGKASFVVAHGSARVVDDRKAVESLWKKTMDLWFPDGPSDPDAVALEVELREGEYWDNRGLGGLKFAVNAIKALVKRQEIQHDTTQHGTAVVVPRSTAE